MSHVGAPSIKTGPLVHQRSVCTSPSIPQWGTPSLSSSSPSLPLWLAVSTFIINISIVAKTIAKIIKNRSIWKQVSLCALRRTVCSKMNTSATSITSARTASPGRNSATTDWSSILPNAPTPTGANPRWPSTALAVNNCVTTLHNFLFN